MREGVPKRGIFICMSLGSPYLCTTIDIVTHFSQKNYWGSTVFFLFCLIFLRSTDRFGYSNKLLMKNTLYQSCNSGDIQKKSKTYNFPIKINIF